MKIYSLHCIFMSIYGTWRDAMPNSSQSTHEDMSYATSSASNNSSSRDEWWSSKLNVTSCIFWNLSLKKSNILFNVDILSQLDDDMSPITVTIYYWNFEYHGSYCCSILYNKGSVTQTL